jgi:4-alpha-glucanotransferase
LRALWQESLSNSGTQQAQSDILKIAEFAAVPLPQLGADFEQEFYAPVLEALFRSESWLAIVMITDLLARTDRFNVPGTAARTNWSRRLAKTTADLRASPTIRRRMKIVRELLLKSGRAN